MVFALALAGAIGAAQVRPAIAADPATPVPIWAQLSIRVGNSTSALVTGHTRRAIRLASTAVDRVAGHDRIVALHNLCLAWLKEGDTTTARGYCDAALRDVGDNPKLAELVRANIGAAQQTLVAEAAETARE
jgi:hypothetical protein